MVFQEDALFPWLTVAENVGFGLRNGDGRAGRRARVEQMLELVGLGGYAGTCPGPSRGMKQRVALARVLVLGPAALLMDEPFAALDAQTRAEMQALLISLQRQLKQTVVFVTHDLEEAVKLADRCWSWRRPGPPAPGVRGGAAPAPRPGRPRFLELKRAIYASLCGRDDGSTPETDALPYSAPPNKRSRASSMCRRTRASSSAGRWPGRRTDHISSGAPAPPAPG